MLTTTDAIGADVNVSVDDAAETLIFELLYFIMNLLQLVTEDDPTVIMKSIDFTALLRFFKQETIEIPTHWLPHLPIIFKLVHNVLKKIPILAGVAFNMHS